jgi:hypothetical protein
MPHDMHDGNDKHVGLDPVIPERKWEWEKQIDVSI